MPKTKRCKIFWNDLEMAFLYANGAPLGQHHAYLYLATGEFIYWSEWEDNADLPEGISEEDLDNPQLFIAVPTKRDLDLSKVLVMQFTAEYLPGEYALVNAIFHRPGAYSNFKSLLEERGLLQPWYDYENAAETKALEKWCEEHQIELIEESRQEPDRCDT